MSTRRTLDFNNPSLAKNNSVPDQNRDPQAPQFHLYEECFERDGAVYLELTDCEFEASQDGVTVKIPAQVWDRIIRIGTRGLPRATPD